MSAAEILEQIRGLSAEEQRELVEMIMDEFGDQPVSESDLTPERVAELERRADEALAHPERCRPFEEVFREVDAYPVGSTPFTLS